MGYWCNHSWSSEGESDLQLGSTDVLMQHQHNRTDLGSWPLSDTTTVNISLDWVCNIIKYHLWKYKCIKATKLLLLCCYNDYYLLQYLLKELKQKGFGYSPLFNGNIFKNKVRGGKEMSFSIWLYFFFSIIPNLYCMMITSAQSFESKHRHHIVNYRNKCPKLFLTYPHI